MKNLKEIYAEMLREETATPRPTWVPKSIANDRVEAFVEATENAIDEEATEFVFEEKTYKIKLKTEEKEKKSKEGPDKSGQEKLEPKAKGEKKFKDLHTKDDKDEEDMNDSEDGVKEETEDDKKKYKAFFDKALKKWGVDSPEDLDKDEKKKFFDYVDKNWKADNEKIDEAAKLPVPVKNTEYGFVGAMKKGNAIDNDTIKKIDRAVSVIKKAVPGIKGARIAQYLDSRLGRHFADVMSNAEDDGTLVKYVKKDIKNLKEDVELDNGEDEQIDEAKANLNSMARIILFALDSRGEENARKSFQNWANADPVAFKAAMKQSFFADIAKGLGVKGPITKDMKEGVGEELGEAVIRMV